MTVQFGTVGFYEAMAEMLNEDPVWAQKSAHLDHTMVFRYGPPVAEDFLLNFKAGKVLEPRLASEADLEAVDFIISGDSDVWRKAFTGAINPTVALARGQIKVEGNMKFLIKNMSTFKYIIEAMSRIDFV